MPFWSWSPEIRHFTTFEQLAGKYQCKTSNTCDDHNLLKVWNVYYDCYSEMEYLIL